MSKTTTIKTAKKTDPDALKVTGAPGRSHSQTFAELVVQPHVGSGLTIKAFSGIADLDVTDAVAEVKKVCAQAVGGDLSCAESMLQAQMLALDAIFHQLASRAVKADYMRNLEGYLRLALKAQAQARATAEALSALKNPAPFIRQQNNVAVGGPQQVVNGAMPPRAGEVQAAQNELLEDRDVVTLDPRAPSAAGRADPQLEALGVKHRPAHG